MHTMGTEPLVSILAPDSNMRPKRGFNAQTYYILSHDVGASEPTTYAYHCGLFSALGVLLC